MFLRRLISIPLIVAVCCATIPAPAIATTSTSSEVEQGKEVDKQILATSNVVGDPLLNAWVDGISAPLFAATARKDVPYSIKILDVPDVNAFSTLGGFVYVDEGTLDFVQSDDELAGVIGHETGHIERRHALQAQSKFNALNLLLGLGSMFSPFLYRFGQIFEAGAIAKIQRDDEYQADKYGLMLMTRTGYDPEAMVSFMQHLGAYAGNQNGLLTKYLADHPDTPKRVAALVGYPELDPKIVTPPQKLAAAIHDQEEARYAIAAHHFAAILATDPANSIAQFHLGETQLALGNDARGAQSLTLAAAGGSPQTKTLADAQLFALRASEARFSLMHPDLAPLRDRIAAAQTTQMQAGAAIATRRDSGRDQLKALEDREETIAYGMPNISGVVAKSGTRLDTVLRNIATMSRGLDATSSKAQLALNGVGTAARNRYGGLLRNNAAILAEMDDELSAPAPAPAVLSTLPQFPLILSDLASADANMVRSVDAARGSLAILDLALGDLDLFIRALQTVHFNRGDIVENDYRGLEGPMRKAVDAINHAAMAAAQSAQLYNMARADQLEARIDLLGLASTPERYATLQRAIDVRFHNATIGYAALIQNSLTPADVVAASIIAADTKTTPQAVVAEARAERLSIVDVANARGMQVLALKVFMGLILFDYTDDPDKEARTLT